MIELLVVIAIIAILASLLLPSLASAKDKGKSAACANNLRQLILATTMYDDDHKVLPVGWDSRHLSSVWYRALQPYLGRKTTRVATNRVFVCPSSIRGGFWGFLTYAQNYSINVSTANLIGLRHVTHPARTLMFAETDGWDACVYPDTSIVANVCYRHSGGNEYSTVYNHYNVKNHKRGRANAVFLDTHIESLRQAPTNIFRVKQD